jgi:hypothetical protein
MGQVIDLHTPPARPEDNQGLIRDLARFSEGLLSEAFIKKKYNFDAAIWEAFGGDDKLVEMVEDEKIRRIRDGSVKRERAQNEIIDAPPILGGIMRDPNANERHKIDSIKALDALASTGAEAAPGASDRFIIQINLGEDVLKFNKSVKPNPHDIDPLNDINPFNDVDTDVTSTPWGIFAAIPKKDGGDNGGHI